MSAAHPLREQRTEMLSRLQSNVPHELRELSAWIVFRLEPKAGKPGEWDKVPYYVNGQKRHGRQGSPDDLQGLTDFSAAMLALTEPRSRWDGLGFAILPCHPVTALDLDKLHEKPRARELATQVQATESYCEISPSGTGRRAFFAGKPGLGNRKNHEAGVEVFESAGFVTVTGDEVSDGAGLVPMPDTLRARLDQMLGDRKERTKPQAVPKPLAASLDSLSDFMRSRVRQGFPKGTRDRSAWLYRFAFELRRSGLTAEQTLAIFMDPDLGWSAPALERRGGDIDSAREWLWHYCVQPAYAQHLELLAADEWLEEPLDFLRQTIAAPFTADDVPPELSRYACEMADAAGFDPSGVIAACVGASAAALSDGLRLEVNEASNYYESARLWIALIGGPGMAKTPSIGAATGPLKAIHREVFEAWQKVAADARRLAELRKEDPEIPPRPALYTSDATTEALAELLVGNERGILFLTDEFESWLGGHDAYRSGGGKDRGEWLRAYDGGPHQVDRVKRGTFFVPNWGVGVLTATTPSVLQKLSRKLPADGLLQRFIPIIVQPGRAANRNAHVSHLAQSYHNTLARLYEYGPFTGVRVVKMTHEASALLHDERDRLRDLALAVEVFGDGFAGHVAKHGGMLARIALTFHAIGSKEHPADRKLEAGTVRLAMRFMRKAYQHAQALYTDLMGYEGAASLARAVAAVLLADKRSEVTRRNLVHSCHAWRKCDDERMRDQAMQFLADMGWLREQSGDYNKAHPTRWMVNPSIHERFAEHGVRHRKRRELVQRKLRGDTDE